MAFAFFVAKLEADPTTFMNSILVLDDPVSSLDQHRRKQTIQIIVDVVPKCAQVIVLSHDPYLVRDLRDRISSQKALQVTPVLKQVTRVQNELSGFGDFDIDDVCASEYIRNHKMVSSFVNGTSKSNVRDVAKAIRMMLEGFYHQRFPGLIGRRRMFGEFIADVESSESKNPISHLKPILKELKEINEIVGQFHHDTDPSSNPTSITDAELLQIAKRALTLVYKGAP